jgi:hypothetical protein
MPDHEGERNSFPNEDLISDAASASSSPLDDLKSGLKVWFDLGLTLGKKLDEQTDTLNKALRRLERNTPVNFAAVASGTYPAGAGATLVLNLGSPDQGTYWQVNSCAVGGTDVNTTISGTPSAGLYVSPFLPNGNLSQSPGLLSAIDRAASLPNFAFYGTAQNIVSESDYLFLIIFNGNVGTQYAANAQVQVFNVAAAGGSVTFDT